MMKTFTEKVYDFVKTIPKGSVRTYGEVAKAIGHPNSARAVGTVLAKNADKQVPCHRVVRSDGKVGEYNGLQGNDKAALLRKEGYTGTLK